MISAFKIRILPTRKTRKGTALLLSSFIAVVAGVLVTSMATLSTSNTNQIVNEKDGATAYYAAEAGVADSMDYLDSSFTNWGKTLDNTDLPTESNSSKLGNNSEYWVSNLAYANNNKIAIVDIIGKYNGAYRKLRARITSTIPKYFDDYGLLTDGTLTIRGNKTLEMSIHANEGLVLSGPTHLEDDSVATQSSDPDAEAPDPEENPIGGYVDPIDVPLIPIEELRTATQSGLNVDLSDPLYVSKIANAPAGSLIYVSNINNSTNQLSFAGNMQSKIIFVDSNITVNAKSLPNLSNVMVISAGAMTVNGSEDIVTSHAGLVDTVFASHGNITLNGSRKFQSLFWTNGSFRQNGSSMAGRVIAQTGITFNGSFTLTESNKLFDYGTFDNIASLSSWQQVSMDE